MTCIAMGIGTAALIVCDRTEVVGMRSYFEGVLFGEGLILHRVDGPVTLEEHTVLIRDIGAIDATLTTLEISGATRSRIEHLEALTLPDTIQTRELITVGSTEHI